MGNLDITEMEHRISVMESRQDKISDLLGDILEWCYTIDRESKKRLLISAIEAHRNTRMQHNTYKPAEIPN